MRAADAAALGARFCYGAVDVLRGVLFLGETVSTGMLAGALIVLGTVLVLRK